MEGGKDDKNVLINQDFKLVPVVYKKVWTIIYWDNDSRTQRYKKKIRK